MVCELFFSSLSQNTGQKQPMQGRIYFKSQFRGFDASPLGRQGGSLIHGCRNV